MDSRRLRTVLDQCPLTTGGYPSLRHTTWRRDTTSYSVLAHDDGYSEIVVKNRLFAWYRTFSDETPRHIAGSFITVHEWVPPVHPSVHAGWRQLGNAYHNAIAQVVPDHLATWGSHAQRDLRTFKKSGALISPGTVEEIKKLYAVSQVPKNLQGIFLNTLSRHQKAHPDLVNISVAALHDEPIACFVSVDCDEIQESFYLLGAFHPTYAKMRAMAGLMDDWFCRVHERGYRTLNLGLIDGPHPPLGKAEGYSVFKTHFGIARVWFSGSFWRITLGKNKNSP